MYLAEDGRLNRKLALKVLSGLAGASPSTIARFRREAEVAARLDHPCICPVLEAGETGVVHRDLKRRAVQPPRGGGRRPRSAADPGSRRTGGRRAPQRTRSRSDPLNSQVVSRKDGLASDKGLDAAYRREVIVLGV